MKILRWVFLVLYVFILVGLLGYAYSAKAQQGLLLFQWMQGRLFWTIFVLAATLISQVLFVYSTGKIDLQRPKNKYIVIVPIAVAAAALAFLTYGIVVATAEFLKGDANLSLLDGFFGFWGLIIIFWIVWGIVFYMRLKDANRYELFKKIIPAVFAGGLLEFLPAVFMHMVTSKRHDCFAGIYTGLGVSFGLIVMLWSFGPGIIFLFIHEKNKAEAEKNCK